MTLKTQNFHFVKIVAYKIQDFHVIETTGMYVIKKHTNNRHTQIQSALLIFRYAMAKKKQVKVMTLLFETQFLALLIIVPENK